MDETPFSAVTEALQKLADQTLPLDAPPDDRILAKFLKRFAKRFPPELCEPAGFRFRDDPVQVSFAIKKLSSDKGLIRIRLRDPQFPERYDHELEALTSFDLAPVTGAHPKVFAMCVAMSAALSIRAEIALMMGLTDG